MNTPTDELATLRGFLNRLETGELTLRSGDQDVSGHEIGVIRREVARLETILGRVKSEGTSDKAINYSGRTKRFSRKDK